MASLEITLLDAALLDSETTTGRVLSFLHQYRLNHSYPPSLREIAHEIGLASVSTVSYHLEKLTSQGRIRTQTGKHRSIVLIEKEKK